MVKVKEVNEYLPTRSWKRELEVDLFNVRD